MIATVLESVQLSVGNPRHLAKDEFYHKSVVFRYHLLSSPKVADPVVKILYSLAF